jgi:hypothetical protein
MKVPQSRDELDNHLSEQLRFLRSSAAAFDGGNLAEAKRLASTLRLLLHDTPKTESLFNHLGLKGLAFVDGGEVPNPRNLLPTAGLTCVRVGQDFQYLPNYVMLGPSFRSLRTFVDWWRRAVIVDNERQEMSREDLVLAMANTDGGAHVDRSIDRTYARLSRQNSVGWTQVGPKGDVPMLGIEFASVRQIAWEVEETLRVRRPAPLPPELLRNVGRNDPCPCHSGVKFKKCHGRPN